MNFPKLAEIEETSHRLRKFVSRTPVSRLHSTYVDSLGIGEVILKLELMQLTGTFKIRGALNNLLNAQRPQNGITAVSAGNHAVAVACACSRLDYDAKIVMLESANPARRELAESYGAELLYRDSGADAFATAEDLVNQENRLMVHPFEGPTVSCATGGVALELLEDAGPLDAVVVAVGGGGLAGGIGLAIKLLSPETQVFGVEPTGADTMTQSFRAGKQVDGQTVDTIANSLGPPLTTAYTYGLCRKVLDDVVLVSDDDICVALHQLFADAKLAVEPAGAAAMAAVMGPLRERLQGKKVGVIVCGACQDHVSFSRYLKRGFDLGH